ncbi:hypothetical protein NE848_14570 [Gramella jeungdoensis]|uniref:LPS export ABC transporter periplasmic protein LptC n=1 Tax=Gramella jeungdoensis TaxID=708091 RepID=A0ABT0Z4F1_9FLAO|nr:hypothetical protein [Gramella jeungdoensis]MCM8570617.1 hypothetical protein [Gramella jeungdoensis]
MKTLIFSLLLIVATSIGHAQKITELEEAKVGFAPLDVEVTENGDSFTYNVHESYAGQFVKDPIAFMKANFDIQNFIATYGDRNYDSYHLTFKSGQGFLKADFDKNGKIVKTYQKFKDIVLPLDVRRELYMAHKGWTMTENKYIASGRGEMLEKELYKIKIEDGSRSQNIKLDPRSMSRTSVASKE